MAEIYIESLVITDFGPYYGEHYFEFGIDGNRRATLIGGKNGAGKTHLLRALYLASVGESGVIDLKKLESGSGATKFELTESLNRKARSEGKDTSFLRLTLSRRDDTDTIGRTLIIEHTIRHRPNSPPIFNSLAQIADDGQWIDDEKKVQKLRDAFLPRHLTQFFFFDAERSQNIQLNDKDIVDGISRVLGLHTYTELETDLRQLISTKIKSLIGDDSSTERKLNAISNDIIKFTKDLDILRDEISDKQQEQQDVESEIFGIENELRTLGAVDPKQLEELRGKRDSIKTTKDKLEANLSAAWEATLPVSLLGDLRIELHDYLIKEESRRDYENRKSSVEPKIPQIKREVFDNVPPEHTLLDKQKSFYEQKLVTALNSLFNPPPEGMAESIYVVPERNELSVQVRTKLKIQTSAIEGLSDLCQDLERKSSDLRELDQALKTMSSDSLAINRGNELRTQLGSLINQKSRIENDIDNKQAEQNKISNELHELKKQETNLTEQVQKVQKGRNLNGLAHKYRDAVSEIKAQAANLLRDKMADKVGNLWLDIVDRGLEFTGMEFDSHWNCQLRKTDGSRVEWEKTNTSAGQRQVRILAFTEALRQLAKFVPPLVVDTPLGRLDKEVRENVLDRLYLSGHQCIILTTNAEIDPKSDLFEQIEPKLARVYSLSPEGDQESNSYHVRVSQDYFKRVL